MTKQAQLIANIIQKNNNKLEKALIINNNTQLRTTTLGTW